MVLLNEEHFSVVSGIRVPMSGNDVDFSHKVIFLNS